ncbi:hypothetical protein F6455_17285 [Proteobacteria bacterium 005FR1]|nr:hypothetical protein [Proteobacteria bacterium 005FR1]
MSAILEFQSFVAPVLFGAKLRATLFHALVTCVSACIAAFLIFYLWYPEDYAQMVGGLNLFLLVCGVELVLGPAVSFIIYNPRKSHRELLLDYSLVGLIQLAALAFGIHSTYIARPVFTVFVKDRFEIVTQADIQEDLSSVPSTLMPLSWSGPELISVEFPKDSRQSSEILFSALAGKDIHLMPRYYRPFSPGEAVEESGSIGELAARVGDPEMRSQLEAFASKEFGWLPVMARSGVWTAVLDKQTGQVLDYLPYDPF